MAETTIKTYFGMLAAQYIDAVFEKPEEVSEDVLQGVQEMFKGQSCRVQYAKCTMTPLERMAYFKFIFASNASATNVLLQSCDRFLEVAREKAKAGLPLKIASFGCGPGSDAAALLWCLAQNGINVSVHVYLFDLQDWSDMIEVVFTATCEKTKSFAIPCFVVTNLLEQSFIDSIPQRLCLKQCDVLLFAKFACEVDVQEKSSKFYEALFSSAKLNAFIVAVDIGYENFVSHSMANLQDIAAKHSFRLLQSSRCEHPDGSVDDCDKSLSQLAQVKPFSYRVMEKTPPQQGQSDKWDRLVPRWKRQVAQNFSEKCKNTAQHFMPSFSC